MSFNYNNNNNPFNSSKGQLYDLYRTGDEETRATIFQSVIAKLPEADAKSILSELGMLMAGRALGKLFADIFGGSKKSS